MIYTLAGSIFENNAAKNLKLENDSRQKILKAANSNRKESVISITTFHIS